MEEKKRIVVMGARRVGKAPTLKLLEEAEKANLEVVMQEHTEASGVLLMDSLNKGFEQFLEQLKKNERLAMGIKTAKNAKTLKRAYHKTGKNEPCPCGSGKKYKHCHMREEERKYAVVS